MSKTLRQRVFEDTGYDMLSPISIARDRSSVRCTSDWLKAKGTPEEVSPMSVHQIRLGGIPYEREAKRDCTDAATFISARIRL